MMDAGETGRADTASEAVLDETSVRTPAIALRVRQAARPAYRLGERHQRRAGGLHVLRAALLDDLRGSVGT